MPKLHSSVCILVISTLLAGLLVSCTGGTILSGKVNVSDFNLPAGQTMLVSNDLVIEAMGAVDIAGALVADADNGQSITIRANGGVRISGSVGAGHGSVGGSGGDITIISENGDITLVNSAFLEAGDGGEGRTTITETFASKSDGSAEPRIITGGAGGKGGTVTLRAPNGEVLLPEVQGTIHLGNGGNGTAIEIHGNDLLTTDTPEDLENSGGDSGLFVIEASSFNGTPTVPGSDVEVGGTVYFSGGKGGDAGSFAYGVDENGNSTWPVLDEAIATSARAKTAGTTGKKIYTDLRRSGAKGGDGYLKTGAGKSVRLRGRNGAAPGTDGQNVYAYGGWGGNCKSPACLEGGNGGSADAMGGNGARGQNPNGTGGDGGRANADGGLGGVGTVNNGRHGDALAFGGYGGKGGGKCTKNITTTGGRGGMGGYAWAFAGKSKAIASAGKGGDGGDGEKFSGLTGGGGLATATNGPGSKQIDGKKGSPGTTCPPALALHIGAKTSTFFSAGTKVGLSCIEGGEVSPPDETCDCRHLHGEITLKPFGTKYPDPDPDGCGQGCIAETKQADLDHACK